MDDTTTRTVASLEAVKTVLFDNGWCQHTLEDEEGRYCIVGAVIHAHEGAQEASWQSSETMHAIHRVSNGDVVNFNNAPTTTFSDIIDLIDAAILQVKESA